ncbi:MAG: glycosyltransferase family 4 protein [Psychroflexus sp.]
MPKKTLLYLGNMLSKSGSNVTSIETLGLFLTKESYSVIRSSSKKNQALRLFDMLSAILKYRHKVDVVLIDTYSTLGFWFAYSSARLCQVLNIPYIPILRGGDLPERLKKNPDLCQALFKNAKINIAPSAYLMHYFKKAGYSNLTYIPNTIEISKYKFQERVHLSPKLLWVRAFVDIYNPILALKVLEELQKTHPDAELSMVGPFKDETIDECRAYAEEKKLPVSFTGGMPKEEWLAYAKDFDVFINTTNVDNTPVSVIEAMALGLPVVSTNVGGLPFMLEHQTDALLVKPDSKEEMTSAIQSLLDSSELSQNITAAARAKVEKFDWEVVKHQWFEVLS